jgi:serine/threonine-protein kinase
MDALAQLNASLSGRYDVEREIGAGGMATVYLARDTRHERHVALKVLRPELGAVLGVERFLSEIRVTANLQHSNLLPLFDSGEADGLLFYVMPYVDGESLRAKLQRETQLPIAEAVRIATAVASALDYAHRHGVIHRDLKPENILLHEGQPLVADFGIALAVRNAGGNRITQTGLSLGTPQYMSPEQATGDRTVDGRTDIYSLGAVLYEMLTGEPPHPGPTAQAIIARVLTDKPRPVRESRASVPVHVEAAIEHALKKLPADRFATAQQFADGLQGQGTALPARVPVGAAGRAAPRALARQAGYATGLLAALGFAAVEWRAAHRVELRPVLRVQLVTPKDQVLTDLNLNGPTIGISPRGDRIAYTAIATGAGGAFLWLRNTAELESKALTPSAAAVRAPAFSPDGDWVAFADGADVKKVSVHGGPVVTLATLTDNPQGIAWTAKQTLVIGSNSSALFLLDERGGTPHMIPRLGDEAAGRFPMVLPDGKTIVYQVFSSGGDRTLGVFSVDGGKHARLDLPGGGSCPLGYVGGYLVYAVDGGSLMAVPFDTRRLVATGPSVPVVADVLMDPIGGAKAALSSSGTLIYRNGKQELQPVLVRGGKGTPLATPAQNFLDPRFSPDGKRIAFTVMTSQAADVRVFDRERGTLTKITNGGANQRPEWTPDGKRLVFVSSRGDKPAFWWQAADGSAPPQLLYQPPQGDPYEALVSPDGKWLIYRTGPGGKPARSIFAVSLDGKGAPTGGPILLAGVPYYRQMPRLSPDGHWLAYQSHESGNWVIYVRPFPSEGAHVQISTAEGHEPLWDHSGTTLYYRTGQDVVAVSVTTGATFHVGQRRIVLNGDYLSNPSHPAYDVSPDGSELLMLRRTGEEVKTILVQNWVQELVARTSAAR